jgi:hypothetical protein
MTDIPLLSLAIWLPIAGGLLVLASGDGRNVAFSKLIALVTSAFGFLVTVPLYFGFDPSSASMQFVELMPWVRDYNINYHLGVDGISMPFVILNSFITLLVIMAGWQVIETKVSQYNAAFLIMSGLLNGIFSSLDGILFYVFFESSLIPLYLVIGIWGGKNRVYAALKFFLYTLLGSLLMLVALLYLFHKSGSFGILDWHREPLAWDGAVADLLGILRKFCGEGADVAGAYLAAGRPRRSADRWFGRAGGHRPEARRIRFPAVFTAHRSRRGDALCAGGDRPVADRRHLHRSGRSRTDRHEEAGGLFVDLAHGFRHAGLLHLQPARCRRCAGSDDFPRLRVGGDVPVHRRDCTTACTAATSPITAAW